VFSDDKFQNVNVNIRTVLIERDRRTPVTDHSASAGGGS
jgi:hypothetical protein